MRIQEKWKQDGTSACASVIKGTTAPAAPNLLMLRTWSKQDNEFHTLSWNLFEYMAYFQPWLVAEGTWHNLWSRQALMPCLSAHKEEKKFSQQLVAAFCQKWKLLFSQVSRIKYKLALQSIILFSSVKNDMTHKSWHSTQPSHAKMVWSTPTKSNLITKYLHKLTSYGKAHFDIAMRPRNQNTQMKWNTTYHQATNKLQCRKQDDFSSLFHAK